MAKVSLFSLFSFNKDFLIRVTLQQLKTIEILKEPLMLSMDEREQDYKEIAKLG